MQRLVQKICLKMLENAENILWIEKKLKAHRLDEKLKDSLRWTCQWQCLNKNRQKSVIILPWSFKTPSNTSLNLSPMHAGSVSPGELVWYRNDPTALKSVFYQNFTRIVPGISTFQKRSVCSPAAVSIIEFRVCSARFSARLGSLRTHFAAHLDRVGGSLCNPGGAVLREKSSLIDFHDWVNKPPQRKTQFHPVFTLFIFAGQTFRL